MCKKNKLLAVIVLTLLSSCTSKIFYGIDGYGKINFYNENNFSYDYYDTGIDTGFYHRVKDTFFLNSPVKSIKMEIDSSKNGRKTIPIKGIIYSENRCLKEKILLDLDISTDKIILNDIFLEQGDIFQIGYPDVNLFYYYAEKDTLLNDIIATLDLFSNKRKKYFDNFKLLKTRNYLVPISSSRKYFEKINDVEFEMLKKGKQNKKYKIYLSGAFIY